MKVNIVKVKMSRIKLKGSAHKPVVKYFSFCKFDVFFDFIHQIQTQNRKPPWNIFTPMIFRSFEEETCLESK